MLGDPIFGVEHAGLDVTVREVGDRVAARLVQQHDVFAVGDPLVGKLHPHPAPQRLGEQQPRRQRLRCEEVTH